MSDDQWHTDGAAAIAVYLSGRDLVDRSGLPIEDDSFYLALNATAEDMRFRLPDGWLGGSWEIVFDTARSAPFEPRTSVASSAPRNRSTSRATRCCWLAMSSPAAGTRADRTLVLRTGSHRTWAWGRLRARNRSTRSGRRLQESHGPERGAVDGRTRWRP